MKDARLPVSSGFLRGRLFGLVLVSGSRFVRTTVRGSEFFFDLFSDAAFACVIGNVPALAFELNRRRRKLFLKHAAAFPATLWLFVGRAHQYFEMRAAFLASIFVNWHTLAVSRLYESVRGQQVTLGRANNFLQLPTLFVMIAPSTKLSPAT